MRGVNNKMNLKISQAIADAEINNYANNNIMIDCSDGINPFGCSKKALKNLVEITEKDISTYFHANDLLEKLKSYWGVPKENIVLCNGSIYGLQLINILFQRENAKLLSFIPHFPDFSNYSKMLGYRHKKVIMSIKNNFKCSIDELIENIDDEVNLIYIDNPNNPTGQVIEKDDLIKLLDYTSPLGIGVVIDEAFGDFLPKEQSCIDLIENYNNLLIVKTFSKGFGLTGIRAGYIISNKEICNLLNKISNPYSISPIAQKLACDALNDINFLNRSRLKIKRNKEKLIGALPHDIKITNTDNNIPISLLYTEKNVDLSKIFIARGVKVYSGISFEGIDKRFVRLNIPTEEKMDDLIDIIKTLNLD